MGNEGDVGSAVGSLIKVILAIIVLLFVFNTLKGCGETLENMERQEKQIAHIPVRIDNSVRQFCELVHRRWDPSSWLCSKYTFVVKCKGRSEYGFTLVGKLYDRHGVIIEKSTSYVEDTPGESVRDYLQFCDADDPSADYVVIYAED